MHRTSRLIKLVACLALVAVATSAAAEADTSGAVLTKVEYQQLVKIGSGTKSALSGRHGSVRAAIPSCRRALGVSPLIRASKGRCVALLVFLISDLNVASAARRCGKLTTTDQALDCLTPSFSALSGNTETLLGSARRVERLATARRFKRNCVAALAGPKRWATLVGDFAHDLKVLVASMRAHNLGLFYVAAKHVDSLEGSLTSIRSASIAVCPHL